MNDSANDRVPCYCDTQVFYKGVRQVGAQGLMPYPLPPGTISMHIRHVLSCSEQVAGASTS